FGGAVHLFDHTVEVGVQHRQVGDGGVALRQADIALLGVVGRLVDLPGRQLGVQILDAVGPAGGLVLLQRLVEGVVVEGLRLVGGVQGQGGKAGQYGRRQHSREKLGRKFFD